MRILHINGNYSTSALHKLMIEHLDQIGIKSAVFVPTFDKGRATVECKGNVTLSECYNKSDRFLFFVKQRKIIKSLLSYYMISDFDIIHAYTLFSDGFAAMKLSLLYGIPYVVAVRNTDLNIFFKKIRYLRKTGVDILRNASAVFFLSPVYRDATINGFVPSEEQESILKKSIIIPNGIDDFWHENSFDKDVNDVDTRLHELRILKCIYVGGIDKNKNIELTLKALTQMNADGWKCSLTCIGKIIDKKLFEKLSEYKCFSYIEPKRKEELIAYYRKADIFVMPSHTETFGLVYAEAISQGVPVIYTRGQGFDAQFSEGEVGYSTSDTHVSELIKAIKAICDNYAINYNGLAKKIVNYNWGSIVKQYANVYEDIINYQ